MSEVRRNPITGDPVVFAPERSTRPRAFVDAADVAHCPFCPGHESETPPEIARVGDSWLARVFPNKYPPLPGAEVIVESSDHDAKFDEIEHALEVVQLYAARARAHKDAAHFAIFKNEGARAGSSIPHLHSQLIPTPFVPLRIAREAAGFKDGCPLCERRDQLMVWETETFACVAPLASMMAYQQWLVPKRHVTDVTALNDGELEDLAILLQRSSAAVRRISDSFNWCFLNFPRESRAHFYIDLFPRLTTIAGFELGTGTFVEIIDPASAVERLRS